MEHHTVQFVTDALAWGINAVNMVKLIASPDLVVMQVIQFTIMYAAVYHYYVGSKMTYNK